MTYPPGPGMPPPPFPQQPKKKSLWWLWGCLGCGGVAFLLLVAGCVALIALPEEGTGSGVGSAERQEAGSSDAGTEAGTGDAGLPGIGDAVEVGSFSITVESVDQGETNISRRYWDADAQGEFVIVMLNVENIGDSPDEIYLFEQSLFDVDNREFASDLDASGAHGGELLKDINPGFEVTGAVVFDVPPGTEISHIELEHGLDTVTVDLS